MITSVCRDGQISWSDCGKTCPTHAANQITGMPRIPPATIINYWRSLRKISLFVSGELPVICPYRMIFYIIILFLVSERYPRLSCNLIGYNSGRHFTISWTAVQKYIFDLMLIFITISLAMPLHQKMVHTKIIAMRTSFIIQMLLAILKNSEFVEETLGKL